MADYEKLLVTTDFSAQALAGVREAARLARLLGSRLVLVYAVEDQLSALITVSSELDREQLVERHRATAEESLARYALEHLAGRDVETVVRVGRPVQVILAVADELGVDLIVMATHGYGFLRQALFGSTTERVLHHARLPVLVVRSDDEG